MRALSMREPPTEIKMKTETPETEKGIDPKMKTPKEVIITETEIFPETEADIKTETK